MHLLKRDKKNYIYRKKIATKIVNIPLIIMINLSAKNGKPPTSTLVNHRLDDRCFDI